MTRKLAAALTLLTAIAHTTTAQALGLGNIEVSSKLNQPLNAKVRLLSIPRQDMQNLGNIKVRLASNEAFQRAGLERPFVLSTLRFKVSPTGDTAANISISTTQPIKEPFLNFLLEIDWPNGRILREYTVLLDPPLYRADATLAPINMADNQGTQALSTRPVTDESSDPKQTITSRPPRATRPERIPAAAIGEGEYGVQRGDSLWVIADRMRAGSTLSREQMMAAIYDANRHAFIRGNMNLLREGQALRRPSNEEAAAVSDSKALDMINAHRSRWTDYREEVADNADTAAVTTTRPQADSSPDTATTEVSKSPLTILGEGRGETLNSTGSGQDSKIRAQLSELMEENKRVQQENKNLEKDLAATKKLVETMQQQLDKVLKVQSDLLAQLESQAKKQGQPGEQTTPESPADATQTTKTPTTTPVDTTAVATPPATGATDASTPATQNGSAATDTSTTPGTPAATETTGGFSVGDLTGKPSDTSAKPDSWATEPSQTPPGDTTTSGTTAGTPTQPVPGETNTGTTTTTPDPTAGQVTGTPAPGDTEPANTTAGGSTPVATTPDPMTPDPEAADFLGVMNSTVNDNVPGGWLTVAVAGAGGGLLLLLAGVPLLRRQRRQREEEAQREAELLDNLGQLTPEGDQLAESGKAPIDLDFSLPDDAAEHLTQPDDVLEEVDVYIAYERYDQAQTLIEEALAKAPNHLSYLLKRLEIDAAMGQVSAFEQHAKPLFDATGGQGPAWEQALLLWDSLNTQRALLGGTTPTHSGTADLAAGAAVVIGAAEAMALDDSSLDMDFDLEDVAHDQEEVTDSGDLDFDLHDLGQEGDTQLEEADLDMGLDMDTDTSSRDLSDDDLGMDFSLDQDTGETTGDPDHSPDLDLDDSATPAAAADSLDMDFDLDMSLDDTQTPSTDSSSAPAASDDELSMDFDLDEGLDMSLDDTQTPSADTSSTPAASDDELSMDFDLDEGLDMSLDDTQTPSADSSSAPAASDDELSMDFDLDEGLDMSLDDEATPSTDSSSAPAASDDELSMDFDLDEGLDMSLDDEPTPSTDTSSAPAASDDELSMDFDLDEGLDMSLDDEPTPSTDSSSAPAASDDELSMDFDLDEGLDMSLDDDIQAPSGDSGSAPAVSDDAPGMDFDLDEGLEMSLDDDIQAPSTDSNAAPAASDNALSMDFDLDEGLDMSLDDAQAPSADSSSAPATSELGMGFDLDEGLDMSLDDDIQAPSTDSSTAASDDALDMDFEPDEGLDESLDMTAETAGEAELDFSSSDDEPSTNLADLDKLGEDAHEADNTALELELEEAAADTSELSLDAGELEMDFDMDEGLELGMTDEGSSADTDTASQDEDLSMEGFELDMDGGESQDDIATIDGSNLATDDEDMNLDFSEELGRANETLDTNALSVANVDDDALDFDLSLDEGHDNLSDEMDISMLDTDTALETGSDLSLETEAELGLDSLGSEELAEDGDFSLATADENEALALSLSGSNSGGSDDLESLLGQLEDTQGLDAMDSLDFGAADEVSAKFDLAQMYLDMDDTDNARSTLLEVLAEGSEEQKARARRMLESVGEPA